MENLTIAIYLRISDEDKDIGKNGKIQSDSVENQRNLLSAFISRTPEFEDADILEFCDDGFSGKNFERPAFRKMMEKVRRGEIQCIIVKDLSRFGRDYLTVGNYISRIFPFLGVRLIAVNDVFDSMRRRDIDSLDTSFRVLLYDFYSQDLSRKVRSAQNLRAEKGEFLSSFAPFGYVKDEKNKKKLVIDPAAAETVRRIFCLAADGFGTAQIARTLNAEGVPTPMRYKQMAGCSRRVWGCAHEDNFWTHNTVLKILRDERYIGNAVYGRKRRDKAGSAHAGTVPENEWIVVENTHEGIVTREEFDKARENIRKSAKGRRTKDSRSLFYRKVRCGVCGYAMERMKGKQPYYSCRTGQVTDRYACPTERISESDLEKAVLTDLGVRIGCIADTGRIWEEKRRRAWQAAAEEEKAIAGLRRSLSEMESQIRALYERFALGETDKEEYLAEKAVAVRKKEAVSVQLREAEDRRRKIYQDMQMEEEAVDGLRDCGRKEPVETGRTAGILQEIISGIAPEVLQEVRIYPGRKLNIIWKWRE